MKVDVLVLGAGMVGVASALQLLACGRSVAVLDRRAPGLETSFGNAGLIQSEAVMPYAFPRNLRQVLGVATGRRSDARVRYAALRSVAPWLIAYARASDPAAVLRVARANAPLVGRAKAEHEPFIERAGVRHLLRTDGYLRAYRRAADLEAESAADERVRQEFGVETTVWSRERLAAEEPHLAGLAGAVHVPDPWRMDDPGATVAAYAALLEAEGGHVLLGDAASLTREGNAWRADSEAGPVEARETVVALGPWSDDCLARFDVRVPMGVKRGYHMHFRARGNATLRHLVVDTDAGAVLTPNAAGLRLTTGAEFARRDDPPSTAQLDRAERSVRTIFPLGERLEATPWRGARPCFPDLLPAIGPVPGVPGLWVNTGHQHLGFTLGPATGKLLAQMMTGEEPFTDPAPYALTRFPGVRAA